MISLLFFAFIAGLVTVAGPCILPILPIILGTSTVRSHRARPILIVLGFVLSFSIFAIIFSIFGNLLGISANAFRTIAAIMIGLFGIMMLFPVIQQSIFKKLNPLIQHVSPNRDVGDAGLWSGFILGLSLGLVWSPCAGPVLGSILTLIVTQQNLARSLFLLAAYALGAGIPMLIIAYGGQSIIARVHSLSKYTETIQRVFGVMIILVSIGLLTGMDRTIQVWFSNLGERTTSISQSLIEQKLGTPSNLPILSNKMPDFSGITMWWNTVDGKPLTAEALKGKVVLVDFWTYSCINCIRTYPFLKSMYDKYGKDGFVIVGVHTPEFAFEKDPGNVGREIIKNGLKYPIALDPNYETWNAYRNSYWPAEYLFDRKGRLRHTKFGEGEYILTEGAIRSLLVESSDLALSPMGESVSTPDFSKIQTPETYFGLRRGNAFMGTPGSEAQPIDLVLSEQVGSNQWTIGGNWTFEAQNVISNTKNNIFKFSVQANQLHIVMDSVDGTDKHVSVYVDGIKTGDLVINQSELYNIAAFKDGERHVVEIHFDDAGVRLYSATFS